MFADQVKIMLYVKNVNESSDFWQRIGFIEKERESVDGTIVVEIAPSATSSTRIVLYELAFVQQHSPEIAVDAPSLMFFSEDVLALYQTMQKEAVTLGELIQLPGGELVFNFADNDGNYFAVSGQ